MSSHCTNTFTQNIQYLILQVEELSTLEGTYQAGLKYPSQNKVLKLFLPSSSLTFPNQSLTPTVDKRGTNWYIYIWSFIRKLKNKKYIMSAFCITEMCNHQILASAVLKTGQGISSAPAFGHFHLQTGLQWTPLRLAGIMRRPLQHWSPSSTKALEDFQMITQRPNYRL